MPDNDIIPMVDLKAQYKLLKPAISEEIEHVLESGHFIRGPVVGEFECKLAAELDIPFVLGVGNGTDALQVAMMALGIGPGDEVITPAFTFIATAEAAHLLGATPVFADVDRDTFNINPEHVEELITEKTRAIIPVHLFGQPARMNEILALGKKHDVPVIEDMAQAIGATYDGQPVGSMGTVGTISFFPSKNLGAYGDAGAVVTKDKDLYEKMKMIGSHGSRKKYMNEMVGINSRLDSMQAAVLKAKLPHLTRFNMRRAAIADKYDSLLRDIDGITIPKRMDNITHVFHQYTIQIEGGAEVRNAVAAHLKEKHVSTAIYYPKGLHRLPVYQDVVPDDLALPVTEALCDSVLSLPIFPELTAAKQERVADAIREAMSIAA